MNVRARTAEIYADARGETYSRVTEYASGATIELLIDGQAIGRFAVADLLP